MTFTTHGYYIPGTPTNGESYFGKPLQCGGIGVCTHCSLEAGVERKTLIWTLTINTVASASGELHTVPLHSQESLDSILEILMDDSGTQKYLILNTGSRTKLHILLKAIVSFSVEYPEKLSN